MFDFSSSAVPIEDLPLPEAIVKTLVISTVSTVGVVAGFCIVGAVVVKIHERKERKQKLAVVPDAE